MTKQNNQASLLERYFQDVNQWQQLLQSYPTVNDWLQLIYGYRRSNTHDLKELHQIQALISDDHSGSWDVIDQAILKEIKNQLKVASGNNFLALDRQLKDDHGNQEGIQLVKEFGKRVEIVDNGRKMTVYVRAELLGSSFLTPSLPIQVLLPNRKTDDELPVLDRAKVVVTVVNAYLTSEKWVNIGPYYNPKLAKDAYQEWLTDRSWWQKHFDKTLPYEDWVKDAFPSMPPKQAAGEYWPQPSDLPSEIVEVCQTFSQQIQRDFTILWNQILGYPSPQWGKPQIKIWQSGMSYWEEKRNQLKRIN